MLELPSKLQSAPLTVHGLLVDHPVQHDVIVDTQHLLIPMTDVFIELNLQLAYSHTLASSSTFKRSRVRSDAVLESETAAGLKTGSFF